MSSAPCAQDGVRYGVAVRGVRRLRHDQRRGGETEAREHVQRPSEWMAVRLTHGDPASVL